MIPVFETASIDRSTLYQIEKGNPSVSMGAYFNVLPVLNLQEDFLKLATDDEFGRKLHVILNLKKRASAEAFNPINDMLWPQVLLLSCHLA